SISSYYAANTRPPSHTKTLSLHDALPIFTLKEWRRAIDIYREKRGLGDALFVAYLHTDGNAKRHPHHVHLMFVRVKSDGSLVKRSEEHRLNSSHVKISYAVFCLKKKKTAS